MGVVQSANKHGTWLGEPEKLKIILAPAALFKDRVGTKLLPRVLRETERIWLLLLSPVLPRILLKRLKYKV